MLGTGGGAFINAETRALVKQQSLSVWLKADFELLFARVSRRSNRPLLKTGDPRATLRELMRTRYPIYAEADITVVSQDVAHEQVASDVVDAMLAHLDPRGAGSDAVGS